MNKETPYLINRHLDRYGRHIWFTDYWFPCVTLRTTVDARALNNVLKTKKVSINAVLTKAAAQALSEFPKLNYCAFWGRLVWAGAQTKVTVILEENKFEECNWDNIIDAEKKDLTTIHQELLSCKERIRQLPQNRSFMVRFMNRFPKTAYYLKRFSGQLIKEYMATTGPMIITNMNIEGVDEMQVCGVYFSTVLCPGRIKDDKMPLLLSFNHQLANARPVGAFLARLKDILENLSCAREGS